MFNNRYDYTDFSTFNLDAILRELNDKITNPEGGVAGKTLMINSDGELVWGDPTEVSNLPATNVAYTPTGILTKGNVQLELNEIAGLIATLQAAISARPIKGITLNNVPVSVDTNGIAKLEIPEGNDILY